MGQTKGGEVLEVCWTGSVPPKPGHMGRASSAGPWAQIFDPTHVWHDTRIIGPDQPLARRGTKAIPEARP